MGQGQSGVLFPGDAGTKTGQPGMEVLREKHPVMHIPDLIDPESSSFEEYKKYPDVMPLDISEEDVQWVATQMIGHTYQVEQMHCPSKID